LSAPDSGALKVGTYNLDDESTTVAAANNPDAQIFYGDQQLDFQGQLDVLDLAWNSVGTFTRFDVVLGGYGEIRFGEPGDIPVSLGQRHIEYSRIPVGFAPVFAPETLHNTSNSAVSLGDPSISGSAGKDYSLSSSTCGSSLAAGASCAFEIGFSPKAAGPRVASLDIPVAGALQKVSLSGSAPLGTTSITTSGNDSIDNGGSISYVDGPKAVIYVNQQHDGWEFRANTPYNADLDAMTADFEKFGGGSLAKGEHKTGPFPFESSGYGVRVSANSLDCSMTGRMDVYSFVLDKRGLPSMAKITFSQLCQGETSPMTGTVLWQYRSDTTAPRHPTDVKITSGSTHKASWKKSTSKDASSTVARLVEGTGADATPTSGVPVSSGSATTATLPALQPGTRYTLMVFAIDKAGNVSSAAKASVGTQSRLITKPSAPTHVSATATSTTITLRISPPADSSGLTVTGYEVQGAADDQTFTSSPATLTNLQPGTTYDLHVYAITAAGTGRTPAQLFVTTAAG
jgi:hypothetical protein